MSTNATKKLRPPRHVSQFLCKTWEMCTENEEHRSIVSWNTSGTYFDISNIYTFAEEVLPKYFRHSNHSTFVRQLNMYGFTKVGNSGAFSYGHEFFLRDDPSVMEKIKRKTSSSAAAGNGAVAASRKRSSSNASASNAAGNKKALKRARSPHSPEVLPLSPAISEAGFIGGSDAEKASAVATAAAEVSYNNGGTIRDLLDTLTNVSASQQALNTRITALEAENAHLRESLAKMTRSRDELATSVLCLTRSVGGQQQQQLQFADGIPVDMLPPPPKRFKRGEDSQQQQQGKEDQAQEDIGASFDVASFTLPNVHDSFSSIHSSSSSSSSSSSASLVIHDSSNDGKASLFPLMRLPSVRPLMGESGAASSSHSMTGSCGLGASSGNGVHDSIDATSSAVANNLNDGDATGLYPCRLQGAPASFIHMSTDIDKFLNLAGGIHSSTSSTSSTASTQVDTGMPKTLAAVDQSVLMTS